MGFIFFHFLQPVKHAGVFNFFRFDKAFLGHHANNVGPLLRAAFFLRVLFYLLRQDAVEGGFCDWLIDALRLEIASCARLSDHALRCAGVKFANSLGVNFLYASGAGFCCFVNLPCNFAILKLLIQSLIKSGL